MTAPVINIDYLLAAHKALEDSRKCLAGIRDHNLLMSAIEGQRWYADPIDQIIHIAYSICAGHVFNDGNKRTTFLILRLLEQRLGFICDLDGMATAILDLATNSISKEAFTQQIKACIIH